MLYLSTRGDAQSPRLPFCDVLLAGLAPDGGLYVPESYPRLELAKLRRLFAEEGYAGVAYEVLSSYIDDIPADDLRRLCDRAYNAEVFGTDVVVPVSELGDGLWLAHLSNGPTAAFKDLAMQLLGQLFEYELERRNRKLVILGATSGDTGSAAEYAMLGKQSVSVFMLSPQGRMSDFQQAQMFSILDPRIVNIAVPGVFDDSQDLVKEVFADAAFKARYSIGAVNSINVARLLAQVVYYVVVWIQATTQDDQQVSFCVPSGNFGNICAGHIAKEMGLPIARLVLATNENTVLHEFFSTGVYRVRPSSETYETSSPSMDISKASNFERFAFDLLARDQEQVRKLFGSQLSSSGEIDLSGTAEFASIPERYGFVSGASSHQDRIRTIKQVADTYGVIIDPHTADGVAVAQSHLADEPMIVLETALPVKFAATIVEAIGVEPQRPERFVGIEDLPRSVTVLVGGIEQLKGIIESAS